MANAAPESPLMAALESFEATEANLVKLERLWSELQQLMPQGVSFGANPEYENRARAYDGILQALPKIDGWKPASSAPDLDDLAQNRFEAMDLGELSAQVAVEKFAEEPGRELREYRFRLNMKRRALIRDALSQLIDKVDADLRELRRKTGTVEAGRKLDKADWDDLRTHLKEIEVLLGSRNPPAGAIYGDTHPLLIPMTSPTSRGWIGPRPSRLCGTGFSARTKPYRSTSLISRNWSRLAQRDRSPPI
jgi:hypothetical protein